MNSVVSSVSPRPPHTWRLFVVGLIGVLSLWWMPVPTAALAQAGDLPGTPAWLMRAAPMINALVLLALATWLGARLAHAVGLRSLIAGTAARGVHGSAFIHAALWGSLTGAGIALFDQTLAGFIGPAWQALLDQRAVPDLQALALGVLYGGITEEIVMRWGLMSLAAWLLVRLAGDRHRQRCVAIAGVLAALAFGAAHLPALGMDLPLTPALVARTLLLNGLAALLYGWLFWRHHLEAAMAAHAATHLGMAGAWALLQGCKP